MMLVHRSVVLLAALFLCLSVRPGQALERAPSTGIVMVNGYPEYRWGGKPFFPYAAGFFYHRIPADLWGPAIVKLKQIGFNTLDLYVVWNWHQPTEDVLDLDGHTNPRRNLKRLLALADSLGMKVILRPGPYIFNEWRNGGYPDWLLRKPGFGMTPQAIAEGWFPIPSSVQYFNSEEASRLWLENETHWKYAARWFQELWKVAGPYSAARGGPIMSVQLDDDLAIGYYNYNGSTFWRYIRRNQQMLGGAGVDVPLFTNAAFMRVTAEAGKPPQAAPLWIWGQWYLRIGTPRLQQGDVAGLQYAVEALKTQPDFPAMIIEFNTNQYGGPEDTHASIIAPPSDMLLAARALYQNGLRGMTVYPAQDTLYPAGWEFPPANYHYMWESALDIGLKERPERAAALRRDGALIEGMGSLIASTHEKADVGLVYTVSAYPQEALGRKEMNEFARRFITLQQLAYHAGINTQYVDLAHEPAEHLDRYGLVLLPAASFHKGEGQGGGSGQPPGGASGQPLEILPQAQQKLLDYVRNGGTLVVVPETPAGALLKPLFPLASVSSTGPGEKVAQVAFAGGSQIPALGPRTIFETRGAAGIEPLAFHDKAVVGYQHSFGKGKVIVLGFDFFAWVPHAPVPTLGSWPPATKLTPEEQSLALRVLDWLLRRAGVQRAAAASIRGSDPLDQYLDTTMMVGNESGLRMHAFVAATNWSDGGRRADLRVADPRSKDFLALPNVYVPARDSVLLPVRIPLNRLVEKNGRGKGFAENEELVYATAEVTSARFANRILTLEMYVPGPSEIVLEQNSPPLGNCQSGSEVLLVTYDRASRITRIQVPAGNAPDYRRTVRVPFPFQPVLNLQAEQVLLPGETVRVRVALGNPGEQPLEGQLLLEVPERWPSVAVQKVQLAPGAQPLPGAPRPGLFEFQVSVPAGAVPGSDWTLRACLEGTANVCSEPHPAGVTEPVRWRLTPRANFPVRDDITLETWPPLWAVTLPGQVKFDLYLENPLSRPVEAKLESEGESILLEVDGPRVLQLAPGKEVRMSLTAWPRPRPGTDRTATGLFPFNIRVRTPGHTVKIPVRLVGIRAGEALAYQFDFDRDGFDDLVLENENLRAIVMPGAAGRAFALVDKATGRNAFNTVGGLRDAFSKNPPTYSWKGIDLRRPPWRWPELRLSNREAKPRILRASGPEVQVELSYEAADVFPRGATVRKKLILAGGSNLLGVEYEVRPGAGDPEQSFRVGSSTSIAGELRPAGEFLSPAADRISSRPFAPNMTLTFGPKDLAARWFAVSDPESSDLLGVFWENAGKLVVKPQRFSTLLELFSPPLAQPRPFRLRLAYCFTHEGTGALRRSYEIFARQIHPAQ